MKDQFADMINWSSKSLCDAIFYIEAQVYREKMPRGEICIKGRMHKDQIKIAHMRLQKRIREDEPSRDTRKYFALLRECQRRNLVVINR